MYTFKKKLITHACALSFLAASVGSGFGAWIFTRTGSADPVYPAVVETDAVVLSEYLQPSFVSKELAIQDAGTELDGIEIRLTASFDKIQGTDASTTTFDVIYSTKVEITTSTDSTKPSLANYISFSSICEMPTESTDADNVVLSPLEYSSTATGAIHSTPSTTEEGVLNINHPFTYREDGQYSMDVCVFPMFDYADSKKPQSIDDYIALSEAVSNTKFTFTFSIVDVAIHND